MISIESKENGFFKLAKKLRDRKGRNKEQKYIIEGFRLIQEAFKAGCKIDAIVVNNDGEKKLNQYLESYMEDVKIYLMDDSLFTQLTSTENTQGIIAILSIEDKRENLNGDFYLLCDKVQDPGNLGLTMQLVLL